MKKRSYFILALIISTLITSSVCATTVEKVVATVDGRAITLYDLNEAMKVYAPEVKKESGASGESLKAKVLDKLIDERVLEIALENMKDKPEVKIEYSEVDTQIDRILRSQRMDQKTFEQQLAEKGMSLAEFRENMYQQMIRNRMISTQVGRKISVSERELKEYFNKHMDEFKSASSVRLAEISIPFTMTITADDVKKIEDFAMSIYNAAQNTSDFEALAKRFNDNPYRVFGGELGVISLKDLNPTIAEVASQLSVGRVGRPLMTDTGIHIIKVLDRAKTSAGDFDTVRDSVYDKIYQTKMQDAVKAYAKQLRKASRVEIKSLQ